MVVSGVFGQCMQFGDGANVCCPLRRLWPARSRKSVVVRCRPGSCWGSNVVVSDGRSDL